LVNFDYFCLLSLAISSSLRNSTFFAETVQEFWLSTEIQNAGRWPSWILIFVNFRQFFLFRLTFSRPLSNLTFLAQAVEKSPLLAEIQDGGRWSTCILIFCQFRSFRLVRISDVLIPAKFDVFSSNGSQVMFFSRNSRWRRLPSCTLIFATFEFSTLLPL